MIPTTVTHLTTKSSVISFLEKPNFPLLVVELSQHKDNSRTEDTQSMNYSFIKQIYSPKPYLDDFRDKIKQRGGRGIIGLQRVFKVS